MSSDEDLFNSGEDVSDEALFDSGDDVELFNSGEDVQQTNEPSLLQNILQTSGDTARHGLQGLTMGFSDEAIGGAKAGLGALTGEGNYSDLYKKYRDIERQKLEESSERSPIASTVGDIAGSFLPAIASGGAAFAPAAARMGLKQAAKLGTGQLAKTAGAKAGLIAGEGAVQALGRSESDIEDLTNDAIDGGASALAITGGLNALGKGVKGGSKLASGVVEKLDESPFVSQAKLAFNRGLEGRGIVGTSKGAKVLGTELKDNVTDLVRRVKDAEKDIGDKLMSSLRQHTKPIQINDAIAEATDSLSNHLSRNSDLLGESQTKQLLNKLSQLNTHGLSADDVYKLRQQATDLAKKQVDGSDIKAVLDRFKTSLGDSLNEQVPGFSQYRQQFRTLRHSIPDTLKNKGLASDIVDDWTMDSTKQGLELYNNFDDLLGGLRGTGSQIVQKGGIMNELSSRLDEAVKTIPDLYSKLGFKNKEEFFKTLEERSDLKNAVQDMLGSESRAGFLRQLTGIFKGDVGTTAKASALGTSQLAGTAMRYLVPDAAKAATKGVTSSISSAANSTANISRKLFNAADDELRGVAQDMMNNPKLKVLGETLLNALDNKGTVGKKAALFSAMQNEEFRKMFSNTEEKVE